MAEPRFNPARPFRVEGILEPGKGVFAHRTVTAWAVMSPAGELCRRHDRGPAQLVCDSHNDIHEQGFNAGVSAAEAKAAKVGGKLMQVLRAVEWSGTERDEDGAEVSACPWCGQGKDDGHAAGCGLAVVLTSDVSSGVNEQAPKGPEVFNG